MTAPSRFDPPHDNRADSLSPDEREKMRQLLELELAKLRSEATAARLEARAAEIEMQIRQLDLGQSVDSSLAESLSELPLAPLAQPLPLSDSVKPRRATEYRCPVSWDEVRTLMDQGSVTNHPAPQPTLRLDGPHPPAPRRPRMLEGSPSSTALSNTETFTDSPTIELTEKASLAKPVATKDPLKPLVNFPEGDSTKDETPKNEDKPNEPKIAPLNLVPLIKVPEAPTTIPFANLESLVVPLEGAPQEAPQRRPLALGLSAVAHAIVLLILGLVTFQTHRPKDQVALTASASEPSSAEFETITIETSEPTMEPTDVTDPAESDVEFDISPVGELPAAKMALPTSAALASSLPSLNNPSASTPLAELKSNTPNNIQFCGVSGGGNHFVYLVDSSGSMKEGFESARRELIQSIEALTPKQRFYVVFFDEKPDYMRISDPNRDEPRSVSATPENKAALARWAMTISKDKGKAPYEPIEFALKLQADVIFLLSDGEFPQGIENLLKEKNKVENLFDEDGPISIVHTIAYHSQEGETRMRRIASQNGGQFRYVPKP